MSNGMRFEVPQFIEIEDKIIGPFTWKQFVYLAGGVGVAVVAYIMLPFLLFAVIGLPVAGLAFALAFYQVNNQPFAVFLESVFRYINSTRTYHWRRKDEVVYRGEPVADTRDGIHHTLPKNGNINSLSRQLELNALQKDL